MAHIAILLLGPFRVTLAASPVSQFEADTARALLAYLAMHPGTAFRREALAGLLWPEKPDTVALQNLRGALNRLRGVIGDRDATPPFLQIDRKTIEFNPQSDYWLDVAEFTGHVAAVEKHRHRHLESCPACLSHLREASQLYWSDFLAGFSLDSAPFEEWVAVERERLHGQVLDALCRLSDALLARGEYEPAQRYARRQIELEPWREEAHRQLMRALALAGQRGAALAQYEICRGILAEELNAEPEAETVALQGRISRGELTAALLPADFHALRGNLPPQLTPFFGRQAELEQLGRLLRDPAYRLVTLTGEGGAGKSRLALAAAEQVAADFAQNAWLVSLADLALTEPGDSRNLLAAAIAQAIGLRFYSQGEPAAQLLEALRRKELLLVLDNFEHLLPAAGFLIEILTHAPHAAILVTSRERLNFQAEYALRVGGLPVPAPDDPAAAQSPAVQLFAERAERTARGFALTADNLLHVVRVCRQVAGLPLAIEMAAAWAERLTPSEIAGAIADDLDFLSTAMADVPAYHRSLRVVFAGSWRLLSPGQQRALAQARVFYGSFSTEAAVTVTSAAAADLVALADKSLLQPAGPERYEVHDLIRQFATETWENQPAGPAGDLLVAEQRVLEERHAVYYLGLVAQFEEALAEREPGRALAQLGLEIENVRRAWLYAVAHVSTESLARGLPVLARYYALTRECQEGERLFGVAAQGLRVIMAQRPHRPQREMQLLIGQLLAEQAGCLNACARPDRAAAAARDAVQLARQARADPLEAAAQFQLGRALLDLQDGDALAHLEQALALAREAQDAALEAGSLDALGDAALRRGDFLRARAFWDQALVVQRTLRDRRGEGRALEHLGKIYRLLGDYSQAARRLEEALVILHEAGDGPGESRALAGLSLVAHRMGDEQAAAERARQSLRIAQDLDDRRCQAEALTYLGHAHEGQKQWPEAQAAYEQAMLMRQESGRIDLSLEPLAGLARVAAARGDRAQARSHVQAIAGYLESCDLQGREMAPEVYFTCYQILHAARDPRAATWLQHARRWLAAHAARIDDTALRRAFLENVPLHREILRAPGA